MPYPPLAVANTFVSRHGGLRGVEHMKLQKLTYYTYGWWLAYNDNPLLTEGPEVWKYGPVFSTLYNVLAPFGSNPVQDPQRDGPFYSPPEVDLGDDRAIKMIDWVWNRYGPSSSFALSDETHRPGTPWQEEAAKNNYQVSRHHRIPDDVLRRYFLAEAVKLKAA